MAEVSDAIGREFQIMLRADIDTCPAPYTFLASIHLHRPGRDDLGVVAPYASKRTPLQEDGRPYAWPIIDGKAFYVED